MNEIENINKILEESDQREDHRLENLTQKLYTDLWELRQDLDTFKGFNTSEYIHKTEPYKFYINQGLEILQKGTKIMDIQESTK